MVDYLPRSAWGARDPKGGPGSLTVSRVEGVVLHWPGTSSKTPITSLSAVASALRGWQAYHMDNKGWSDIAYQVAVDQAGRAWTLRGLRTQSGANGNADLNERYGAILLVLIAGEQPSDAMKATVRAVIADYRRIYPNGDAIKPHSAVRPDGTDCPGPAARAAITRGDFTPRSTTPPQEEDMPYTPEQLKHYAGQGVHGQKIGRTDTTFALAVEGAYKNSAAALSAIASVGAAVVALGNRITSEDTADDAEFRAAMAKLDATLADLKTEIGKAIPQPPKA